MPCYSFEMIELTANQQSDHSLGELVLDLTPMLDILFILLVFFMLTAGAVLQAININLPASGNDAIEVIDEPKHILLEISAGGYALDSDPAANFAELQALILDAIQAKPEHELVVAGDKDISIERLLRVLSYLQAQGVVAANILMNDTPQTP